MLHMTVMKSANEVASGETGGIRCHCVRCVGIGQHHDQRSDAQCVCPCVSVLLAAAARLALRSQTEADADEAVTSMQLAPNVHASTMPQTSQLVQGKCVQLFLDTYLQSTFGPVTHVGQRSTQRSIARQWIDACSRAFLHLDRFGCDVYSLC